jgi:membrane-bound lytic murein transglycosylase D
MGQFFRLQLMLFLLRHRSALQLLLLVFFTLVGLCRFSVAGEVRFPMLSGLEEAVEFWKQIFTRYGLSDVVFFDPLDPGKVYSVLRIPDNDAARAIIDKEQARIIADYELNEQDGRVRSQRGAKEQFSSGLKISGRYLLQMQKIFREEGLPPELAYLPLVESSFNVRARSSAGAVGMWQFMSDTGKKFLRVTEAVDERRDPLVSSRAAARLLKENYRLLGNWPLAITAYNHGTDGIFRGIEALGSRNLMDLIQRYESPTFGFASKNFYAEFLAALDVATNSDAHFPFLRAHRPLILREVEINRRLPVQSLLKPAAISQNDFFDWNPALDSTTKYLPVGYKVKLPPAKVDSFLAAQRRLSAPPSSKKPVIRARTVTTSQARHGPASAATAGKTVGAAGKSSRQVKGAAPTRSSRSRQQVDKVIALNTVSQR